MRRRSFGLWLAWLGALWLLVVFVGSIVDYSRGIDVVALLIALIGQLVVAIAWLLWRPLPLWIVAFWGLILASAYVGLLITVPGGFFVSWMLLGLLPVGILMMAAAILETDALPRFGAWVTSIPGRFSRWLRPPKESAAD